MACSNPATSAGLLLRREAGYFSIVWMERSPSSVWGHGFHCRPTHTHTQYDTVSQALAHHYPDGLNTSECDSWLGM